MTALLSMRGVRKRFGAVEALRGVDLEIGEGEVHALLGENGAGKSTLMKILSGAVTADAGKMTLRGLEYRPRGPLDALERGVAMIYQELNLAPQLTVRENVVLGREPRRFGVVHAEHARRVTRRALERLGHPELPPDARVAALGPAQRQLVEIARAIAAEASVVVMDEPTSSLTGSDADKLFEAVRRLRGDGVSVIYISHFLEEVMRVADRYTVIRDGVVAASGEVARTSVRELVEHMVGRPIADVFARVPHEPGTAILELDALTGRRTPKQASLALRRGEIFGIAGLVGAGRTETLRALFGLEPIQSGRIRIGAVWDRGAPPWVRLEQGIGLLSEDRAGEGLVLAMSLEDNVTLSHLRSSSKLGWIDRGRQRIRANQWIQSLRIRAADARSPVASLSGGNQQKVAIARLLDRDVDVALLDEPTRGIDIGSKADIYRLMGELAARGKAILFVSSYLPELLGVCDRIAVMHRGVLSSPRSVHAWTEATLLEAATRGAA